MATFFFAEISDTFGGEANYAWVARHKIRATSERGALVRLNRAAGLRFRSVGCDRYDSASGATCAFIVPWEDDMHAQLFHVNTDLA